MTAIPLRGVSSLTIALKELIAGTPGITPAFGAGLAEAAAICFNDRGHPNPASMRLDGALAATAAVHWERPNNQALRCWGDHQVTTEHGAYGIAALLVEKVSELRVIERARKGKGFDFWLGRQDDPGPLFQNRARLEVSGLRAGTESEVGGRVKQKVTQIDRSRGPLPGIVVVVDFGEPRSRLALR